MACKNANRNWRNWLRSIAGLETDEGVIDRPIPTCGPSRRRR
jgi:hypothetical protein